MIRSQGMSRSPRRSGHWTGHGLWPGSLSDKFLYIERSIQDGSDYYIVILIEVWKLILLVKIENVLYMVLLSFWTFKYNLDIFTFSFIFFLVLMFFPTHKLDISFFLNCTACQHPAQKASIYKHLRESADFSSLGSGCIGPIGGNPQRL